MLSIVRQTQLPEDAQGLCSKGFVQFDNIHIVNIQSGALQHFAYRRHRPQPHKLWLHARGRHRHNSCAWG
jgi:hypothetical protein